ncbi:hypothetical protein AAE478_010369 [Parahypoxylon ruwenzoriense]
MATVMDELRSQWANPGDILSLLLLIYGDIVQKAIAQLIGYRIHICRDRNLGLSIAPVAFSFGWAAYGFSNLLSAVGDMNLMPTSDCPSLLVNCSNGFVRENQSWVLGRLLRDHEIRFNVDARSKDEGGRAESIRIDTLNPLPVSRPTCDFVWRLGWVTLLAQWTQEKWSGLQLKCDKVTCLTRDNEHLHIMVFIGARGSWDLECLATRASVPRPDTGCISLLLAILWTCLLISISGLTEHTWFLVGIGGIGMLQNIFAAGTPRKPGASDFHITRFSHAPTTIGRLEDYEDDMDCKVHLEEEPENLADIALWASEKPPPVSQTSHCISRIRRRSAADINNRNEIIYAVGVHGALIELEKWVPTAGLAMSQIFFPAGLKYNNEAIRDNVHKKFWQRAYHTKSVRKRAEEKRRAEEETQAPMEV